MLASSQLGRASIREERCDLAGCCRRQAAGFAPEMRLIGVAGFHGEARRRAMVHARVRRLVYGASDPKAGAVESVMSVLNHPAMNHQMEVRGGRAGRLQGE